MDTYMCKIGHSQMAKQKNVRKFIYNPPRQPEGEVTSTSLKRTTFRSFSKRRLSPAPRWQPVTQYSNYEEVVRCFKIRKKCRFLLSHQKYVNT
jgi:hypothetical protein